MYIKDKKIAFLKSISPSSKESKLFFGTRQHSIKRTTTLTPYLSYELVDQLEFMIL